MPTATDAQRSLKISRPILGCDQSASSAKNADFARLRPAVRFGEANGRVGLLIPETTERQSLGNQVESASVAARSNFVKMHPGIMCSREQEARFS
jgi:hypothetical protein